MTDYTASNLVDFAMEKKPEDFKNAFDELMIDKIAAALEVKRAEIAKTYFETDVGAEEEQDTETVTNSTEEEDGQDNQTNA